MVDVLWSSKAHVVVSEYPAADTYFDGWHRVEKNTVGSCRTGRHNTKAKQKTEVLYMNFEPKVAA